MIRPTVKRPLAWTFFWAVLIVLPGCSDPVFRDALVLTELPRSAVSAPAPKTVLDQLYPPGSRVILADSPIDHGRCRVLSQGLAAAGAPVVAPDGRRILFAGKQSNDSDWQIFEVSPGSGYPRQLTFISGGAASPALIADGSLVFVSPVPRLSEANSTGPRPALFVQASGGKPRQLTFSSRPATDPTVLADGRILFVSSEPSPETNQDGGQALYTINSDGTEFTAFAGPHNPPGAVAHPRQLPDGRIAFLSSAFGLTARSASAETVRLARPFQSRAPLFPKGPILVRSVEPTRKGSLLVCAQKADSDANRGASFALYRTEPADASFGALVCADPAWEIVEAVEACPHPAPMGRLSSVDPTKTTGRLLCLDANFTAGRRAPGEPVSKAARMRLLATNARGAVTPLGEVPVQSDGSFLVEVPADTALGFEALDGEGNILRRTAPMIWVRPGENRSCVGCHAPYNRAPHNFRPLALSSPVPVLKPAATTLAQTVSRP